MTLTEPAVALTDFALAIECAVFVALLARGDASDKTLRLWFVVFFASAGLASVLGGSVHGFFPDKSSDSRQILWQATLLAILVTALAAWNIGAGLLLTERNATVVRRLAILQLGVFSFVVLFVKPEGKWSEQQLRVSNRDPCWTVLPWARARSTLYYVEAT